MRRWDHDPDAPFIKAFLSSSTSLVFWKTRNPRSALLASGSVWGFFLKNATLNPFSG